MPLQQSVAVRNARLDAVEAAIGGSAILKLRTGAPPASCAAADTGTVLATLALPADWMAAAANATKAKLGTWEDTAADAAGTIGHFRFYASDGATCHLQGTVTMPPDNSGDLQVDNTNVAAGQQVVVSAFTLTAPNA